MDLCEIARNSVIQSSYEDILKKHWIGDTYNHRLPDSNGIFLISKSKFLNIYYFVFIKRYKKNKLTTNSLFISFGGINRGGRVHQEKYNLIYKKKQIKKKIQKNFLIFNKNYHLIMLVLSL